MKTSREPPIVILKSDYETLRGFVSVSNLSPIADYLADELDRARVEGGADPRGDGAAMGY